MSVVINFNKKGFIFREDYIYLFSSLNLHSDTLYFYRKRFIDSNENTFCLWGQCAGNAFSTMNWLHNTDGTFFKTIMILKKHYYEFEIIENCIIFNEASFFRLKLEISEKMLVLD